MSVTPGPNARSPSIRNGRSATVPGSNTVSVWPIIRTRALPLPPRRPITRSPSRSCSPVGSCRMRSISHPPRSNLAWHRSAIAFTPSGV